MCLRQKEVILKAIEAELDAFIEQKCLFNALKLIEELKTKSMDLKPMLKEARKSMQEDSYT